MDSRESQMVKAICDWYHYDLFTVCSKNGCPLYGKLNCHTVDNEPLTSEKHNFLEACLKEIEGKPQPDGVR